MPETIQILKAGWNVLKTHDERVMRSDYIGKLVMKLIQEKDYITALEVFRLEVEWYKKNDIDSLRISTYTLGSIVLALILQDYVLADKMFYQVGMDVDKFFKSREADFSEKLLRAYKEYDWEEWEILLKSSKSSCVFPPIVSFSKNWFLNFFV